MLFCFRSRSSRSPAILLPKDSEIATPMTGGYFRPSFCMPMNSPFMPGIVGTQIIIWLIAVKFCQQTGVGKKFSDKDLTSFGYLDMSNEFNSSRPFKWYITHEHCIFLCRFRKLDQNFRLERDRSS